MPIAAVRSTQFNSGSLGENHQQTRDEVARNTPKFHQYRTVWKEQQATTPTILTGGGVQESQDKTGANVERFSRQTYPWRRDCNSNGKEVVSNRDREPGRELHQA